MSLTDLPADDAPLLPDCFHGRRNELDVVCGRLRQAELLSSQVIGGPCCGKTSLLRYLTSDHAGETLGSARHLIRVYVDAPPLGAESVPVDFWIHAFRELRTTESAKAVMAARPEIGQALTHALERATKGQLDLFDLQDVFDSFAVAGYPVILLVDEFDTVIANDRYLPPAEFFNQVRNLCNRMPRGLAFVASASRPLSDVGGVAAGPSPPYNHFLTVPMEPLGEEDVRLLVDRLAARAAVTVASDAWRLLAKVSEGQPMVASRLTRKLIEASAEGRAFGLAECQSLVEDPDGPVAQLTRSILTMMNAVERQALTTAVEKPKTLTDAQRHLLYRLRKYALLPLGVDHKELS